MPSTPRRTLLRAAPAVALLLTLTACAGGTSSSSAPSSATSAASAEQTPSARTTPTTTSGEATAMDLRLTIAGHPVAATLNDSATARDFAALLPLTLDLEDFHQAEKNVDLPRRLSTSGAPEGAAPKAGDLGYYAPWGQLVLYYRDVPYADGIVILGHLADDRDIDRLATASKVSIEAAR